MTSLDMDVVDTSNGSLFEAFERLDQQESGISFVCKEGVLDLDRVAAPRAPLQSCELHTGGCQRHYLIIVGAKQEGRSGGFGSFLLQPLATKDLLFPLRPGFTSSDHALATVADAELAVDQQLQALQADPALAGMEASTYNPVNLTDGLVESVRHAIDWQQQHQHQHQHQHQQQIKQGLSRNVQPPAGKGPRAVVAAPAGRPKLVLSNKPPPLQQRPTNGSSLSALPGFKPRSGSAMQAAGSAKRGPPVAAAAGKSKPSSGNFAWNKSALFERKR
jgi:hypothetical protein